MKVPVAFVQQLAFQGVGGIGLGRGLASVLTAAVNAAGTGYLSGDVVLVGGGTAILKAVVRVTQVGPAGQAQAVQLMTPGVYTAAPATPNTPTGGTGSGLTLTLTLGADVTPAYPGVWAELVAEVANCRWRDDGVAPTAAVGNLLTPYSQPFAYRGPPAAVKVIGIDATAVLDVTFYANHRTQ